MIDTQLVHGDCMVEVLKLAPKSIDFICIDPPYGVSGHSWDNIFPMDSLWRIVNHALKPNGVVAIFGNEPFASKVRTSNQGWYRYDWYWLKNNVTMFTHAKICPLRNIETISIFSNMPLGNHTYNPQGLRLINKRTTVPKASGDRLLKTKGQDRIDVMQTHENYPRQLLAFKKESNAKHTFQKPSLLLEYLIRTYTNTGEVVLDFCMGSGSTGVACVRTDRNFIGIEIDEKYFNIAKERIEEA